MNPLYVLNEAEIAHNSIPFSSGMKEGQRHDHRAGERQDSPAADYLAMLTKQAVQLKDKGYKMPMQAARAASARLSIPHLERLVFSEQGKDREVPAMEEWAFLRRQTPEIRNRMYDVRDTCIVHQMLETNERKCRLTVRRLQNEGFLTEESFQQLFDKCLFYAPEWAVFLQLDIMGAKNKSLLNKSFRYCTELMRQPCAYDEGKTVYAELAECVITCLVQNWVPETDMNKSSWVAVCEAHIDEIYRALANAVVMMYLKILAKGKTEGTAAEEDSPATKHKDSCTSEAGQIQRKIQLLQSELDSRNKYIRELEWQLSCAKRSTEEEDNKPEPAGIPEPAESESQLADDEGLAEIELPRTGVVFVGGHRNMVKHLKNKYPGWTFIGDENLATGGFFIGKSAVQTHEIAFLWSGHISHPCFWRVQKTLKQRGIPMTYVTATNKQMLELQMKANYRSAMKEVQRSSAP